MLASGICRGFFQMIDIYQFIIDTLVLSLDLILASVPMMAVGVFIAELIISFNITDKLSRFSRPITDYANLHPDCGISFLMAFVSPKAANAMLVKYEREEAIRKSCSTDEFFSKYCNALAIFLPVYIPLLGRAGIFFNSSCRFHKNFYFALFLQTADYEICYVCKTQSWSAWALRFICGSAS